MASEPITLRDDMICNEDNKLIACSLLVMESRDLISVSRRVSSGVPRASRARGQSQFWRPHPDLL